MKEGDCECPLYDYEIAHAQTTNYVELGSGNIHNIGFSLIWIMHNLKNWQSQHWKIAKQNVTIPLTVTILHFTLEQSKLCKQLSYRSPLTFFLEQ